MSHQGAKAGLLTTFTATRKLMQLKMLPRSGPSGASVDTVPPARTPARTAQPARAVNQAPAAPALRASSERPAGAKPTCGTKKPLQMQR